MSFTSSHFSQFRFHRTILNQIQLATDRVTSHSSSFNSLQKTLLYTLRNRILQLGLTLNFPSIRCSTSFAVEQSLQAEPQYDEPADRTICFLQRSPMSQLVRG